MLSIDNTVVNKNIEPNRVNQDDFTYLDNEGDNFIDENPKNSKENPQEGMDFEGGGEIVDKNLPVVPQPNNLEHPDSEISTSPISWAEDRFLGKIIPTKSSFFSQQPQQSSPEKLININKQSIVPRYILDEERKTRSQGGDNRIHVQIALHNPIKRKI